MFATFHIPETKPTFARMDFTFHGYKRLSGKKSENELTPVRKRKTGRKVDFPPVWVHHFKLVLLKTG
jgi:hypothetical protein